MTDTIPVMIGDEEVLVPVMMSFASMKRAWPAINARADSIKADDDVALGAASAVIISLACIKTRPELTGPAIEDRLRIDQYVDFIGKTTELLIASKILRRVVPGEGEAKPAAPPPAPLVETTST